MHILVVNDDGPPSENSSPFVHLLITTLQSAGHTVSVVLPHIQRSWIGKAHVIGAPIKPSYFRPGTVHKDDGTVHERPLQGHEDGEEWVLVDGTPASCVQVGLFHYFQERGKVDLVVSGPNFGRNATAIFALSSGTIGGAMEAAVCGFKAISLSYAFFGRNWEIQTVTAATDLSVKLIDHLYGNWEDGVHLYNINVPLKPGVDQNKILVTDMLQNTWASGSCLKPVAAEEGVVDADSQEKEIRQGTEGDEREKEQKHARFQHRHFKWSPRFQDVNDSVARSPPGSDGWAVMQGYTSVTPLKANFMHSGGFRGELKLSKDPLDDDSGPRPEFYALVDYKDDYVEPLMLSAIKTLAEPRFISSLSDLPSPSSPVLQFRAYEELDFEHMMAHPYTSLANAYVIRKALIRKHYLSTTIASWISKHPDSILQKHFKPAVEFELDYPEFLDEALAEAFELGASFERNLESEKKEREWWILKPGMSDRGQGIRLFDSEDGLRGIFEEWERNEPDSEEEDEAADEVEGASRAADQGIITSQLRHFIAQPYIHKPLLLNSSGHRKFHIRTYVLAVGSLKVYVYREMLALFAAHEYKEPWEEGGEDLGGHLTNTCLQDGTREGTVRRFWDLEDLTQAVTWKDKVYREICEVTGEAFDAAAQGMMVHFQTLPNVFEMFGVDFLVDDAFNVWLLELNAFPDFKQTGGELQDVVKAFFERVARVGVIPFFAADAYRIPKGMDMVLDIDLGRR